MNEDPVRRNQTKLNFIWTKKTGKSIKKGDGVETYIVFSNKLEDCTPKMGNVRVFATEEYKIIIDPSQEVCLTNRTDAYFLNSYVVGNLI